MDGRIKPGMDERGTMGIRAHLPSHTRKATNMTNPTSNGTSTIADCHGYVIPPQLTATYEDTDQHDCSPTKRKANQNQYDRNNRQKTTHVVHLFELGFNVTADTFQRQTPVYNSHGYGRQR